MNKKDKKPLVSIIIPTFNEEKNIVRLLKSINSQSYSNIESIVVDDGSKDNTVAISKKYATKTYARKHAERSVQRNYGAFKAKGQYLMFLDADMELETRVVKSCVDTINTSLYKALIIPEKTAGTSFTARVRRFEREMYEGDLTIEVARFFDQKIFHKFEGYDVNLTGAEDYDLPARIMKKYKIGWSEVPLVHHEEDLTLLDLLKKKYYYASKSVTYAQKHPELIAKQGTIIFRRAYLRNWFKFIKNPVLGMSFIVVRLLVTLSAVLGFVKTAGIREFIKTFFIMIKA